MTSTPPKRPPAEAPSKPGLRWVTLFVLCFVVIGGMALLLGWAHGRLTHPAVWFWLLSLCASAAAIIVSVPFVLSTFFPRAAASTEADLFRPVARPPSRWFGPSIGWPAFLAGTVLVMALATVAWIRWTSDPSAAGIAAAVVALRLLAVARPWGHARHRVPTRFPFGPTRGQQRVAGADTTQA